MLPAEFFGAQTVIPRSSGNIALAAILTVGLPLAAVRFRRLWPRYRFDDDKPLLLSPLQLALRIGAIRQMMTIGLTGASAALFLWLALYNGSSGLGGAITDCAAVACAGSAVLSGVVLVTNRPTRLVPPGLRDRPGFLEEYRALRHRGITKGLP